MTFEEFLQSPYLSVIGDKMLEASKQKQERKYIALNKLASRGGTVILGDSLAEYFPVWELFEQKIFNRGVAGDTSEETRKRLTDIVLPLAPAKAILWVGTNDIHVGIPLEKTTENVTAICETLQEQCGTQMYILSVAPVNTASADTQIKMAVGNRDNGKICELNAAYEKLCKAHGWQFINVYDELCVNGTLPDTLSEDGLHVNIAGYMPVVKALKEALQKR